MSRTESIAGDPVIGAVLLSPSRSRDVSRMHSIQTELSPPTEEDPLLGGARQKKPFYRPRPLWLVPFALTAAISRGMTLAPRVQVFTQLSCNALLHQDSSPHQLALPTTAQNHTPSLSSIITSDIESPAYAIYPNTPDVDLATAVPPGSFCTSDPRVQQGAARLQTIMMTTMGFLSALTTGWWGHFGERHGRTKVLALSTFGMLLTDIVFILVGTSVYKAAPREDTIFSFLTSHTVSRVLLLVVPVLEGMLGGWSTIQSQSSAYISDCTSAGSRSHIFSRFTGVFFLGVCFGPSMGGWIIRHTGDVTTVFWVTASASLLNVLLVGFVFPESLNQDKREKARHAYFAPEMTADGAQRTKSVFHGITSALAVFLPVPVVDASAGSLRQRKDYSLTVLASALFLFLLSTGIYQLKYLYAEHVYGWGAEQLSYYISMLGGTRAVVLLLIMPVVISWFKPKVPAGPGGSVKKAAPTLAGLATEINFDLNLARISVSLDIVSNVLVCMLPLPNYDTHKALAASGTTGRRAEVMFALASAITSFGGCTVPAVQSLALCVLQARALLAESAGPGADSAPAAGEDGNVGRVFGALAVLQAAAQMILGPMLFGLVYSETVATYPQAIFVVATGALTGALVLLVLVRSPLRGVKAPAKGKAKGKGKATPKGKGRRSTSSELRRGRSRASKDLSGGAFPAGYGAAPTGLSAIAEGEAGPSGAGAA
ncbi:major facilitator superfamily domain-containing protein [Schizophyllum amplum]|uniref:Major facilitator superfamily domain-containing protein n=1 Tax=Schizophyllum amplum TaxID=97359 RepID=A0A550CV60_9AGAR|nr:major facilitator superfamily domain-containing protein [Auriculariopsis ampla]